MKKNTLWIAFTAIALSASAQTTIPNGDFETWGNVAPGINTEPTGWYSNKSGSTVAKLGDPTAFKETSNPHSGTSCVRIETINYLFGTKINGSLTTGVINAPSTDKAKGYVGTINLSEATDIRRTAFVGRPDSLVGWYKYTQGGSAEKAKVVAILHNGEYNDPEVPVSGNTYANTTANRVGKALFVSAAANVTGWTRFSVPFTYTLGTNPEYIMLSITSSNDQMTNVAGSKLWLDDLEVIYNPSSPTACDAPSNLMVTQNATTVDLSWTAALSVPVGGYGYSIINADSSQSMVPLMNTTNTFVNGISVTQAQFSENLSAGSTYIVYLVSMCGPSPTDPAITLISDTVSKTFTFGSGVGVNETTTSKFNVFAHDKQLTVDLTDEVAPNAMLRIIDLTGKEILKVKLKGNEKNNISIPTSIKSGTYFYTVWGTTIQKTGKIAF